MLFHRWCAACTVAVPYLIFTILLLTFCAVDLRRLRIGWIDVWIMAFQVVIGCGSYVVLRGLGAGEVLSEGVMMGILSPVASSVAVVSCMLGADRKTVTTYTILGNIVVAIVAPIMFTAIGVHPELSFMRSLWIITCKIAPTLALPLVVAAVLQWLWPSANNCLARYRGFAFYLWAVALLLTLGQTIHYMAERGAECFILGCTELPLAFSDCRDFLFLDPLTFPPGDKGRIGRQPLTIAEKAFPLVGIIQTGQFDPLLVNILPDVHLRPVADREGTEVLADILLGIIKVP